MAYNTSDTASIHTTATRGPGNTRFANFSLETFSSADFIVKDFIESLSKSAAPASRKSQPISAAPNTAQAFDPKPLIRAFEQALGGLKVLSEDLELRENELSASVRRAEAQHNQNVRAREKELEQAVDSFRNLEQSLDSESEAGGNAAVRIGERLEELDKQRQRAQDTKFIVQCWLEVSNRGDLSSLEDVRRLQGGDGKVRCAHIARQLLKISQRLEPADRGARTNGVNGDHATNGGRRQPKEIIEKFLEALEKDLLKQFDDSYRRQNFEGMRECAAALRDFGDGASVMGLFVNQHQFFIDRSQLVTEEVLADSEMWDRLADPDAEPPGVEPTLQSLIDEVKLVAQEESFIIKRAFPYHEEVLARFIQRVFQQSVQQKLEQVLDKASSVSSLAFLRSLQSSKSYISALVDDLKAHGLTEHPEPASATTAAILDQQLDDLFVPYFAGSSYIEREKRSLEELYSSLLFKFTTYHSRRKKAPTSYLSSLQARSKEMIHSARETYLDRLDSSDIPASQKKMLVRLAGISSTSAGNRTEIEVSDEDGELSLPYIKRMLKWLAEGVGRGLELAGGHETPKDVRELLSLLINNIGELYLETALDAQIESATMHDNPKSEPDYSYVRNLQASISILHLLVVTAKTLLMPLAASNLTIRREVEKTTNTFIDRVETKIDTVLGKTIDSALAWTGKLFSSQKKTDFRPSEASLNLEQLQTPTCTSIFNFLNKLFRSASVSLSGRVLDVFALELGLGLRSLLLVHFRSFQVSQAGGVVVTQDMTKYLELLRSFHLPDSFDSSIEVLTEIPNLFTLRAEALKERLRGLSTQSLPGVERSDLRPYVQRREDAGTVAVQAALGSL
ncbi:exocyst complex component Sec10 [Myriangium duriaei CBS 260.36]|uniref:Exocyst complex component Sec10 n=1 Tax=Myriangium duriaei CBS 260.36 TaxID=1168546 RepID=A0A9P4MM41_9PEZI|nr:exocyst complex component Sec10 [Myriangium duriaei CBS 260.36]